MVEIFIIEDNIVRPTTQVLLISPFSEIWERDTSKNKGEAIAEFSYIEFMTSPMKSNPYRDYEEDMKHVKIVEEVMKKKNYTPDTLVIQACDLYKSFIYEASFAYQFLEAAKRSATSVRDFLLTAEDVLADRTRSGGMVLKPAEITRTLKDTRDVLENIESLEKKVFEEIASSKTKGNREINYFEK